MDKGVTQTIAEYVARVMEEDIADSAAVSMVRRSVTDVLACIVAGRQEPVTEIIQRNLSSLYGSSLQAHLIGTDVGCSALDAAFWGATVAHALDYDDVLPSGNLHPSCVVFPTALAAAEMINSSGREVIKAYIVGSQVMGWLGHLLGVHHYSLGWHPTATVGVVAAACTAAAVWRLTVSEIESAIALAASQSGGLQHNFGTMAKAVQVGFAARNGLLAADLARNGVTGSKNILDGEQGFLAIHSAKPWLKMQSDMAMLKMVENTGLYGINIVHPAIIYKRYPSCYATHRPIATMLKLMNQFPLDASGIASIDVEVAPGALAPLKYHQADTPLKAKFSMEYVMAAAAYLKRVTLHEFTREVIENPDVQGLAGRVKVRENGTLIKGEEPSNTSLVDRGEVVVQVNMTDGQQFKEINMESITCDDSAIQKKLVECLGYARVADKASTLIQTIQDLNQSDRIRDWAANIGELLVS
ncbi:MAG: hypothetical protein C7B45_01605 [Sulfobacillus acidophilus]|uniref:MmgE/PrpD family protein n=1 Tax=Sulfobacillus acidophilus TaxID=53633 RepID=A0A2T2WNB9_9FIRM|nr:MAG: hypothetical protein C7B45_01605 [Sulfobacillus acidophilus]